MFSTKARRACCAGTVEEHGARTLRDAIDSMLLRGGHVVAGGRRDPAHVSVVSGLELSLST